MLQHTTPSLEIDLCGTDEVVAESLLLRHALVGEDSRRLVRGKFSSTLQGASPLPWTSAVRAFVQLALQVALHRSTSEEEVDPFLSGLSGDKGSLCRSLDYAISKKPAWVLDLFGSDIHGDSLVGRFFWRRNPEGKRPGSTSVALNTKMLPASSILVRVNGVPVKSEEGLKQTLEALQVEEAPRIRAIAPLAEPSLSQPERDGTLWDNQAVRSMLGTLMKRELQRTLSTTPIFSRQGLTDSVRHIRESVLFNSTAGKHASSLDSVLKWSSHAARTGISPSLHGALPRYSPEKPLKVSVSVVTIGTIVLFQYLKIHRALPIEINYRFSTGIEVARAVQRATIEPDVCAGAAPSASALMGNKRTCPYEPVMLMPKHTHRMLASRNGSDSTAHGDFRILKAEPSGALAYFQELVRGRILHQNRLSLNHCDPDESLQLLAQGDPELRSILWFPAYDLAQLCCGAKVVNTDRNELGDVWILLLAHERLRRNKAALSLLITELHGAWLDLRENEALMERILRSIVCDPEYIKVLTRSHGFHQLRNADTVNLKLAV